MDLIEKLKQKVQDGDRILSEDWTVAVNGVLEHMRAKDINSVKRHETFFQNCFDSGTLELVVTHATHHQKTSRQFALLFIFLKYKRRWQDMRRNPFKSIIVERTKEAKDYFIPVDVPSEMRRKVLDTDMLEIVKLTTRNERYNETNKFDGVLEGFYQALSDYIHEKYFTGKTSRWTDEDVEMFTRKFVENNDSFDVGCFFYTVVAESGRNSALKNASEQYFSLHVDKVDPEGFYSQFWKYLQLYTCATKFTLEYASHYFLLGSLVLFRNNPVFDNNAGLCATLNRLFEQLRFWDDLRLATILHVEQKLPLFQHGTDYDSPTVVYAVQYIFSMGAALQKWCNLIDAASGRFGEGASRLRNAFYGAKGQFPVAERDPSLFFALDQLPPTFVRLHISAEIFDVPNYAEVGIQKPFRLCVRTSFRANLTPLPTFKQHVSSTLTKTICVVFHKLSSQSYTSSVMGCLYERYGVEFNPRECLDLASMLKELDIGKLNQCMVRYRLAKKERLEKGNVIPAFEGQWIPYGLTTNENKLLQVVTPTDIDNKFGEYLENNDEGDERPVEEKPVEEKKETVSQKKRVIGFGQMRPAKKRFVKKFV